MKIHWYLPLLALCPPATAHSQSARPVSSEPSLHVQRQASGPFQVNSYLVYDSRSREAALVDAGSALDDLLATIDAERLSLRYVLLTHCHQDHVVGLPALRRRFPKARLCVSRQELSDAPSYAGWRTLFDAPSVAAWEKDAAIAELMDFDYAGMPEIDVPLEEPQSLLLGDLRIQVLATPGHSRGSLTFSIADLLFPGDLLLYHAAGYIDYPLGSRDQIVRSIRRLYEGFPDQTVLCPGHGESSTIGFEKEHNRNVRSQEVTWEPSQ